MSDANDLSKAIERIVPPEIPPPDTPDALSREEELDAGFMAELPPQKRNTVLYERTIATLEKHHAIATKEKNDHFDAHAIIKSDMEKLTTNYAALKQAYRDARATNGLAALLMVVGGTAVSVAGATSDVDWKPRFLWAGCACFVCGFLFAAQSTFRNPPDSY